MTRYALFLRGINVGGVRVPMPELRGALTTLGCRNVRTWLATGNVMLDDARSPAELTDAVETCLTSTFGYPARVLVRQADELADLVRLWPFGDDPEFHRYVVLGGAPVFGQVEQAKQAVAAEQDDGEAVSVAGRDLMWRCPKGASTTSPVARVLAKSKTAGVVTTRNLNTIERMVAG